MVGPKSTQTRVVGILADEMHAYIQYSSYRASSYEKCVGMHLVCYYPYSGFSPHWSGVVGSNHHSTIFTTTLACFTTTHRG